MKNRSWELSESEVTDKKFYLDRRRFIEGATLGALALSPSWVLANKSVEGISQHTGTRRYEPNSPAWLNNKIQAATQGEYRTKEKLTPHQYVTQYNNFYEFGTDKGDPFVYSQDLRTDPWSLEISGEAEVIGKFTLEDILKPHDLEERIYRLRCVEAWSMVVPWIGISLGDLLRRFKPTSRAKYVRFKTLLDPAQMPAQGSNFKAIDYPYVEGLRIDEAMNELAFLSVGLYGEVIPPQNGAPLRLIVPWKYGFKSIKSIVSIEFMEKRPKTTWEISNAREYGFYANVNPAVDHPRWSQATERRLPSSLFKPNRIDTVMFNGYAAQVAHLYADLDLRKHY